MIRDDHKEQQDEKERIEMDGRQNRVLTVHMLGEFWLDLDGKRLDLPGNIFSKTMNLFVLMLLYGDEGIARRRVLELLYSEEDGGNSGRLRTVAFRLKRQLIAAGLMTETDSFNEKGVFRWKPEGLEIRVDARIFKETAVSALKKSRKETVEKTENEQAKLLAQACGLYEGELLIDMTAELWVAENQAYYQGLYFQCVRRYLKHLAESRQYEQMLVTAREAARIYSYEEWYIAELDALTGMGRWEEALEEAEAFIRILMDKMGVHPSEELMEKIRQINLRIKGSSQDLSEIRDRFREPEYKEGGFYCNFSAFVWIYRHEMRRIEKEGQFHYLLLCSITGKSGEVLQEDQEDFQSAVADLGEVIRTSLRRIDIYTRYSKNQYLLLLLELMQGDCSAIISRIENRYRTCPGAGKYQIHYFNIPVAPDRQTQENV